MALETASETASPLTEVTVVGEQRGAGLPGEDDDWDFGTGAGQFLAEQLKPEVLAEACEAAGQPFELRLGQVRPAHGRDRANPEPGLGVGPA